MLRLCASLACPDPSERGGGGLERGGGGLERGTPYPGGSFKEGCLRHNVLHAPYRQLALNVIFYHDVVHHKLNNPL
jgi:hypothetical protein